MDGTRALLTLLAVSGSSALEARVHAAQADPWADVVIRHEPGLGGAPGYDVPSVALGPPARLSGGTIDPGVVSPFQPAWTPTEIVSLGLGGRLTLGFDEWVEDDPANPFGIDLIIFGNAGFTDGAFPFGTVSGLFGGDGGEVWVSEDGVSWIQIPGCLADGAWPTLGYQDAGPYDAEPGLIPTDATLPMDPALDWSQLLGSPWDDVRSAYGHSAGGVGIDLAEVGLSRIAFVEIRVFTDAFLAPEVDAAVDVRPVVMGDLDADGQVTVDDLLILLAQWGPGTDATTADLDQNGSVDVDDLLLLLSAWP